MLFQGVERLPAQNLCLEGLRSLAVPVGAASCVWRSSVRVRVLVGMLSCLLVGCTPGDEEETPAPTDAPTQAPTATPVATPSPTLSPDRTPGIINEVACADVDWVELGNPNADKPLDLGGWVLTDKPDDETHRLVFPDRALIPPRGLLYVTDLPFGVKCGEDRVQLLRPDQSVADAVDVAEMKGSLTWGRLPDLEGAFAITMPTPGKPNREPSGDPMEELFDPYQVWEVELGLSPSAMVSLEADPYSYVDGTFALTMAGDTLGPMPVGIQLKGHAGSFRGLWGKAAFKVKFNHIDDELRLFGLKKLNLHNMVQDLSTQNQTLSYELSRALEVPSARTGYTWVKVNGEDFGLYLTFEPYDDVFLSRWFDTTQHLYEGEYGVDVLPGHEYSFDVDEGDEEDLRDLQTLIAVSNETGDEGWLKAMEGLVDLDEMLLNWAFEIYIGHWDGYAPTINNYYLHSDDAGMFAMLPSGTDQTFSSDLDFFSGGGALFARCMTILECRSRYTLALQTVLQVEGGLALEAEADVLLAQLMPYLEKDPRLEYYYGDVPVYVEAMKAYMSARRVKLQALLECLTGPDSDVDEDGYLCDLDCDDHDPAVYPEAEDVCEDGVDQDCDGVVDNGLTCPDCVEQVSEGRRYLVCPVARSWEEARAHCQALGADLAVLEGADEQARLLEVAGNVMTADWWIGLSDLESEGSWVWVDGSSLDYSAWSWGEPNDAGGEDCGELYSSGVWNDLPCSVGLPQLCEGECVDTADGDGDGLSSCEGDCSDKDASVYPGAEDVCADGIDQDCDGRVDNGPSCPDCTAASGGGRDYLLCSDWEDWGQARRHCQEYGMDLVMVGSEEEQGVLEGLASAWGAGVSNYWLGLTDEAEEGVFVWWDGSSLGYSAWALGEPNNYFDAEDCGEWMVGGGWNDLSCGDVRVALCEVVGGEQASSRTLP